MGAEVMGPIGDGLIDVAKRDCPTCTLIEPVYRQLADGPADLVVYSQDDPAFPESIAAPVDDRALEVSWRLKMETVPTLIRMEGGREAARAIGWHRGEWESVSGQDALGAALPEAQPGCGSRTYDPGMEEVLELRYGEVPMAARRIELGGYEDPVESAYERGWSDGLPIVPPTEIRVLPMLKGTMRDPSEVIGRVPPNLAECTVEKVAINAVMAGCKPEYMPVALAAVETALIPEFCMHGLLCTTYFSAPIVIVNGPIAQAIGMNSRENALGQGNRANATIGRALQLVIRNVGGGVPGGIDRATLGTPGKYSFCFAEDESNPCWTPLSVDRGFAPGTSTVTLFGGDGILGCFDQASRTPESLTKSLATSMQAIGHPKKAMANDALLVISPEHLRTYANAGWSRRDLLAALDEASKRPGRDLVHGAGDMAEGMPESVADQDLPKFRPGGLDIVRAGGEAGMMSAIIGGWAATGKKGSQMVTKEVGQ